jgi:hypothetical protein
MIQITYREAAKLLGKSLPAINVAVGRGSLTKVPSTSTIGLLIKEQVELFRGKQISIRSLTPQEQKRWEAYRDSATSVTSNQEPASDRVQVPITGASPEILQGINDILQSVTNLLTRVNKPYNASASERGKEGLPQETPFTVKSGSR